MSNQNHKKSTHGWTAERRKKQAELIHQWQPWCSSTGAITEDGKKISARNAYKGSQSMYWRNIQKQVNATLREQKELLDRVKT